MLDRSPQRSSEPRSRSLFSSRQQTAFGFTQMKDSLIDSQDNFECSVEASEAGNLPETLPADNPIQLRCSGSDQPFQKWLKRELIQPVEDPRKQLSFDQLLLGLSSNLMQTAPEGSSVYPHSKLNLSKKDAFLSSEVTASRVSSIPSVKQRPQTSPEKTSKLTTIQPGGFTIFTSQSHHSARDDSKEEVYERLFSAKLLQSSASAKVGLETQNLFLPSEVYENSPTPCLDFAIPSIPPASCDSFCDSSAPSGPLQKEFKADLSQPFLQELSSTNDHFKPFQNIPSQIVDSDNKKTSNLFFSPSDNEKRIDHSSKTHNDYQIDTIFQKIISHSTTNTPRQTICDFEVSNPSKLSFSSSKHHDNTMRVTSPKEENYRRPSSQKVLNFSKPRKFQNLISQQEASNNDMKSFTLISAPSFNESMPLSRNSSRSKLQLSNKKNGNDSTMRTFKSPLPNRNFPSVKKVMKAAPPEILEIDKFKAETTAAIEKEVVFAKNGLAHVRLGCKQMMNVLQSLQLISKSPTNSEIQILQQIWHLLKTPNSETISAVSLLDFAVNLLKADPDTESDGRGTPINQSMRRPIVTSSRVSAGSSLPRFSQGTKRSSSNSTFFQSGSLLKEMKERREAAQRKLEEKHRSQRSLLSSFHHKKLLERADALVSRGLLPPASIEPKTNLDMFDLEKKVKEAELMLMRLAKRSEEMSKYTFHPLISSRSRESKEMISFNITVRDQMLGTMTLTERDLPNLDQIVDDAGAQLNLDNAYKEALKSKVLNFFQK